MARTLITGIGELVTLKPLADDMRFTGIRGSDLGLMKDAWVAIANDSILEVGTSSVPVSYDSWPQTDAGGGLVMPGLIDSHTHPVFAGNRAREFRMRLDGKSYQDIAAAGGGILSTVEATRKASDQELSELLQQRLIRMRSQGVTTIEAKSGYGLTVNDELRLLRIIKGAEEKAEAEKLPHIESTCLALHAVPKNRSKEDFIREMTEEVLPIVAEGKLANWADAFVEPGYFLPDEIETYIEKAHSLGLGIRVHADEFADGGAAAAAARWRAASADHLQQVSADGRKALAESGVVATVLPGTSLYCGLPFSDGRALADAGCAVAIASDFNPGSCQIDRLALLATAAGLHNGLNGAEVLAGVTWVAARALRLERQKGCLTNGYDADLLIYRNFSTVDDWLADFGRRLPCEIMVRGSFV